MKDNLFNQNNDEFIKTILANEAWLSDEEVAKRMLRLPSFAFISVIKELSNGGFALLLRHKELILSLSNSSFQILFLNARDENKLEMIKVIDYLKRILLFPPNQMRRTLFDMVHPLIKKAILESTFDFSSIHLDLFESFLKKLDLDLFEEVIHNQHQLKNKSVDTLVQLLENQYHLEGEELNDYAHFFKQHSHYQYYFLKIKNKHEIKFLKKFDLFVSVELNEGRFYFEDGSSIEESYVNLMSEHHLKALINHLKIDNPKMESSKIIITAIKLYAILGYDNAKKVLDNKFTYMTPSGLKRAALTYAVDTRRKYRLNHQDEFFSYKMENKVLEEASKGNQEYFIRKFDCSTEESSKFLTYDEDTLIQTVRKKMNEREKKEVSKLMAEYISNSIGRPTRTGKITGEELYRILLCVSPERVRFNKKGMVEPNENIIKCLLGNLKSDNDALLRLLLNQKAFGLNNHLELLINNFYKLEDIVEHSHGKMSLNSLLDIVDMIKALNVNMKPNEQDMTLENFMKILHSNQHCCGYKEEIFLKARELHYARRFKTYSSIPLVSGETSDLIRYRVIPFQSPDLITIGIETDSCLKVGAKGEDFLRYIMTQPHAYVIEFIDEFGERYICPFLRNGNVVYGNGIDPKPTNNQVRDKLLRALEHCAHQMIEQSNQEEPIDYVTITDLHLKDQLDDLGYIKMDMDNYQPSNDFFHTDFHMKEDEDHLLNRRKTFILQSRKDAPKVAYYLPQSRYYQARTKYYIFDMDQERDLITLSLLMNDINYSSLNYLDIEPQQKEQQMRQYQMIEPKDFKWVVGNKDWFIGYTRSGQLVGVRLPYDERSVAEYEVGLGIISEIKRLDGKNYEK